MKQFFLKSSSSIGIESSNWIITSFSPGQLISLIGDEANKKYVETPIGKCKVKMISANSSLCELPKKIDEMMGEYALKPGIIYVTDK